MNATQLHNEEVLEGTHDEEYNQIDLFRTARLYMNDCDELRLVGNSWVSLIDTYTGQIIVTDSMSELLGHLGC